MSTPAQAAANAANAQASTGPRTEAGKAASSRNSTVFGLYSGDFVRPGEETAWAALEMAVHHDLAPVGALEEILAEEITRAAWRLRRCGMVESHLVIILNDGEHYIPDPMETTSPHAEKMQKSVDRARAQAHRLMHKATAELRKLQTERHFRQQNAEAESDLPQAQAIGLADTQALAKTPRPSAKPRVTQRTQSHPAEAAGSAQTTDSQPETQPEIVLAA